MAGFSGMDAQERLDIIVRVQGVAQAIAKMHELELQTQKQAAADLKLAAAQDVAAKKSFMHQQAMFTMRRAMFYTTLGVIGLGAAVIKMGFDYNSTIQTAKVGLQGFIKDHKQLNADLQRTFVLAAKTPFRFQPIMLAIRRFMPLTKDFNKSYQIVADTADALAGMGVTTDAALQRSTIQLQHMMNVGHLTGQMLQNIGKDAIPIQEALRKSLHKTGAELKAMIARGQITGDMVTKAVHQLVSDPKSGYFNAAQRQSTKSFAAAWSTFQDIMSMASGAATSGIFKKLQTALIGVNTQLGPGLNKGKVSLDQLVNAMDKQLTPSTHALAAVFYFLKGAIMGVIVPFYILFWLFGKLNGVIEVFGLKLFAVATFTKALGIIIGILIGIMIIEKAVTFATAEMILLKKNRLELLKWAYLGYTRIVGFFVALLWGENAAFFANVEIMSTSTKVAIALRRATIWLIVTTSTLIKRLWTAVAAFWAETAATTASAEEMTLFTAVVILTQARLRILSAFIMDRVIPTMILLWEAYWPILVVAAILIGLTILYFKWKRFRDMVNQPTRHIWDWIQAFFIINPLFTELMAPVILMEKYWHSIYDWMMKIASIGRGLWSAVSHPLRTAKTVGHAAIWGAQHGGVMPRSGTVLVGEHGPEVMRLPGGSMIQPIAGGVGNIGSLVIHVVPQGIYLDSKLIGNSVAQAYADVEARR